MIFDIISITEAELETLSVKQLKLLRDAQRSKDELVYNSEKELEKFRDKVWAAGMKDSTLLKDKKMAIGKEVKYKCAILADNLIFNMNAIEASKDSGSSGGGSTETGYLVDYSLSYNERYIIVRNYYLAISDVNLRMKQYSADEVAKKYLGSYYVTLYNVLATYEK